MIGRPASVSMQVEPFTPDRVTAVKEFNRRLAAGGAGWRFPVDPVPTWLPRTDHSPVFQEYFLLTRGDDVRGAYILKHHDASLGGEVVRVGSMYWLVSEGTIDRSYALVGRELIHDALRRQSLLFGVGLEGTETPLARLLRALGWRLAVVPFHFKVVNGSRFLREIRYLRSTRLRRWVLDLASMSGLGWGGAKLAGWVLTRRPRRGPLVKVEPVDEFGAWTDELWERSRKQYSVLGVRDSVALNSVFPRGKPGFVRLKVSREGRVIGLAVLRDARDPAHVSFGNLRLGTIADCFSHPDDANEVVQASVAVLEQRGVDLIISNQTHPAGFMALRRAGLLPGPSTCVLATSAQLTDRIARIDPQWQAIHVNRGDGDYPWGLTLAVRTERDGGP